MDVQHSLEKVNYLLNEFHYFIDMQERSPYAVVLQKREFLMFHKRRVYEDCRLVGKSAWP